MKPAGFWIRVVACFIDQFIIAVPTMVLTFLLFGIYVGFDFSDFMYSEPTMSFDMFKLLFDISLISFVVGAYLYYWLMPASKYQGTLGKKWLGLKIVNEYGEKISKRQSLARLLLFFVSYYFWVLFIIAAFGKKQALHDMICKTYVVYRKSEKQE